MTPRPPPIQTCGHSDDRTSSNCNKPFASPVELPDSTTNWEKRRNQSANGREALVEAVPRSPNTPTRPGRPRVGGRGRRRYGRSAPPVSMTGSERRRDVNPTLYGSVFSRGARWDDSALWLQGGWRKCRSRGCVSSVGKPTERWESDAPAEPNHRSRSGRGRPRRRHESRPRPGARRQLDTKITTAIRGVASGQLYEAPGFRPRTPNSRAMPRGNT